MASAAEIADARGVDGIPADDDPAASLPRMPAATTRTATDPPPPSLDSSSSSAATTAMDGRDLFRRVVHLVRESSSSMPSDASSSSDAANDDEVDGGRSDARVSDADKLRLYGLYKRATVGRLLPLPSDGGSDDLDEDNAGDSDGSDESGDETNDDDDDGRRPARRPSAFQLVARYKYDAWAECDVLSRSGARMAYVELAAGQTNPVGRQCLRLLEEYRAAASSAAAIVDSVTTAATDASVDDDKDTVVGREGECCDGDFYDAQEEGGDEHDNHNPDGENVDSVPNGDDGDGEEKKQERDGDIGKISSPSTVLPVKDAPRSTTALGSVTAATSPNDGRVHDSPPHVSVPPRQTCFLERFLMERLNVRPLLPRGKLDVTIPDLLYGLLQCLRHASLSLLPAFLSPSMSRALRRYEDEIARAWPHDDDDDNAYNGDIVVGLSVRSLLDLYLTAKSYPPGSEVIIAPPITIPGMIDVMEYHGLKVVPVDLPPPPQEKEGEEDEDKPEPFVIGVDVDAVEQAVTDRTVAIMVVHPFGIECASDRDMEQLCDLALGRGLDLIEDCAECYAGRYQRRGGNAANYPDVRFFSFGTIKTATALGGGVAMVRRRRAERRGCRSSSNKTEGGSRNEEANPVAVAESMKRIQRTVYGRQTNVQYARRIAKCLALHMASHFPWLFGLVFALLRALRVDYDRVVMSLLQGFASIQCEDGSEPKGVQRSSDSSDTGRKLRRRCLLYQIRREPSPALLSVLHRRILQAKKTANSVKTRIKRCEKLTKLLSKYAPGVGVPRGVDGSRHLYWLYPILVAADRNHVSNILMDHGFDVPKRSTQLKCVASLLSDDENHQTDTGCPRATKLMDKILYLPTSSTIMTQDSTLRLVEALQEATRTTLPGALPLVLSKSGPSPCFPRSLRHRATVILASLLTAACIIWIFPHLFCILGAAKLLVTMVVPYITIIGVLLFVMAHLLRTHAGALYIDSSDTFAKFSPLMSQQALVDKERRSLQSGEDDFPTHQPAEPRYSIFDLDALRLPVLHKVDSTEKKDERPSAEEPCMALLTGATGFIGSLLLRDLLLHRKSLPVKGGVVVICRSKRSRSAADRIRRLLAGSMFSFLSEEEKSLHVTVVEGDVTLPYVGMTQNDFHRVCTDMNISHVFHCAAAVSFTQTLEDAATSNITSSLQMQSLTKKLRNKGAKYIHLSTAFVHGRETGTAAEPLPERLFPLHPYDPLKLYRSMVETQSYASSAMHDLGFPNTYSFSKCVCEHLLLHNDAVDTIIVRPSIVGPAVVEPYEGWAGDKPSTIVAAACLYLKHQYNLWCLGRERVSFIPVDIVCRFVLSKAFSPDTSNCYGDCISSHTEEIIEDGFLRVSTPSSFDGNSHCVSIADRNKDIRHFSGKRIYTAAWDTNSPQSSSFLWVDYGFTILQLGAIQGYFSRPVAYVALFITVKVFPALKLSKDFFTALHNLAVRSPLRAMKSLFDFIGWKPKLIADIEELEPFLDLPLLFYPFTNATFHFATELEAPIYFSGEKYMFSCAVAADRFVKRFDRRMHPISTRSVKRGKCTTNAVAESQKGAFHAGPAGDYEPHISIAGGKKHKQLTSDMWWALTQPRGGYFIRLAGWVMIKLLRLTTAELAVDINSFASLAQSVSTKTRNDRPHVILAPTHRSLFDFLVLSFVFFALPEIGVDIPHIAAAREFALLPIVGWFARCANAFFLKRGTGKVDPELEIKLRNLKNRAASNSSACIEVFIEGKRSRDRRFIRPKTGFLRCLHKTGGDHLILPISINYECMPDQSSLCDEADGKEHRRFQLLDLFWWLWRALTGRIKVGRIYVSAARAIPMHSSLEVDFANLARDVQRLQQSKVAVSSFHLDAGSLVLALPVETIRVALLSLGCNLWPSHGHGGDEKGEFVSPPLPQAESALWTIMLQYGHFFAPFFALSHPHWCEWLNPSCHNSRDVLDFTNKEVKAVVLALTKHFEAAESAVDTTLDLLCTKGFRTPTRDHVMQYLVRADVDVPTLVAKAAVDMKVEKTAQSFHDLAYDSVLRATGGTPQHQQSLVKRSLKRIIKRENVPALFRLDSQALEGPKVHATIRGGGHSSMIENESFGAWGYKDSGFVVHVNDNNACVTMKGDRYNISGRKLPHLIPFFENATHVKVDPLKTSLPLLIDDPLVSPCDLNDNDLDRLRVIVGDENHRVSTQATDRARHGTGHTQEDMFLIRSGSLQSIRLPDAVIWPENEREVESLVALASSQGWCLIPFGGGTNVSHATRCPSKEDEPRPIISVDMRRMSRILWVNDEDGLAHVESGISGSALVHEMKLRGFTIGHEPDSIEFSTLGGWIATKASGMKKNRYGNIEDIVRDIRVAGSAGMMWQQDEREKSAFGRTSTGIDLRSFMLGSEGCLGIVTSAVIKIWALPECIDYESVILSSFEDGCRFVRDVARMHGTIPASVRLLDNEQFRLGRAMRKEPTGLDFVRAALTKLLGSVSMKFSVDSAVCATITFEGSKIEVESQKKAIRIVASKHGGMLAGSEIGRAGYELTFAIAYLRDFAMTYYFLAESFETFVPWSKLEILVRATKARIRKEHRNRALPGVPFVSCRVTQLYDEGVCVYFYFCMHYDNVDKPSTVFSEIEAAAREEILLNGGSLSHHHGVGKLRAPFMDRVHSESVNDSLLALKKSIDPKDIFGARNNAFGMHRKNAVTGKKNDIATAI